MKLKKILLVLLLLIPISVNALEYPQINSKIIEVYDLDDSKVLYELNSKETTAIASLTKIATAMVAIENIENLDEKVTITWGILNTISYDAHKVGLKAGSQVTYRDLLYATMVSSGADAANALAILSSESIANHVNKMNDLAKKLGLEHTHFSDVIGLDDNTDYSTADELRKLLVYCLKNPTFKEIYTTKKHTLSNGLVTNTSINLYNNYGSIDTSFIIGSKTGFTDVAGYCLSYITDINGHEMLIISLKAERKGNTYYNIVDASNIVKFMRDNYKDEILTQKDAIVKTIPVKLSHTDKIDIYANKDIKKYLPSDYDIKNYKIVYDGKEELDFRTHKGDKIGKVSYYYNDELLLDQEIMLKEKIDIDFIKVLKTYYLLIIAVILIITILVLLIRKKKKRRRKRRIKKY